MTTSGTIRVRVTGDNDTGKMFAEIERRAQRMAADLRTSGAKAGVALTAGLAGALTGTLRLAAKLATVGEAVLLILPPLIAGGAAILEFAKAASAAGPALIAMGAAVLFVKMTIGAIAPAIERHMKPISDAFDVASQKASFWATRGIRPLAAEWAKAGMPIVSRDMTAIARETNLVVKGFLEWSKSAAGLGALKSFTSATSAAMVKLGPSVQGVAISFGAMLGRISKVSIAAGSDGLSGILDKLNAKMDKITGESVQAGLDKLKEAFHSIKGALQTVKNAIAEGVEFWKKYEVQIGYVRDALSVLAIAFGGPIGIAVGGASLIQRHWDKIKPVIDSVKEAFDGLDMSDVQGAMDRLGGAVSWLKGEWQDLADWLKGTLWPLIKDELPAIWQSAKDALNDVMGAWDRNKESIGEFYAIVKELGKMLAEYLVPILGTHVVNTFKAIGQVISVAITGFGIFARAITTMATVAIGAFGRLLDGATWAFGWIPGIGDKLKRSNEQFKGWAAKVLASMNTIDGKTVNVHVKASTAGFYAAMARVRATLNDVQYASAGRYGAMAHGGIVGAATGGIHGGLRLVGEQGPELVELPYGSKVNPAGTTRNMMQGMGAQGGAGGGETRAVIDIIGGNDDFAVFMRKMVRIYGGGNVQAAFGISGR